jgi:hypothetical protein
MLKVACGRSMLCASGAVVRTCFADEGLVARFPRYCHSSTVHRMQQERKMAPRASIMVLVVLVAFLSPSQSLALKSSPPSGACKINSGLNAGKTGRYDTKQDPGHVYCCAGDDCTECLDNACTNVGARGGANRPPSAGTNSGPSEGGNTGVGAGPRPIPKR